MLFGTDGIRGIPGRFPLTRDFIRKIGYAVGLSIKQKNKKEILIASDTRFSCDWIKKEISKGFIKGGLSPLDIGIIPTPACAKLVVKWKTLLGCVISASHNPYNFNGIKFFYSDGYKLPEKLEKKIETTVFKIKTVTGNLKKPADFSKKSIDDYYEFLSSTIDKFIFTGRIFIDCANGATFNIAQRIFQKYITLPEFINIIPNGKNINLNCGSEYISNLQRLVKQTKYDGGIAFDGDGDRVIFVDGDGRVADGDHIILFAAKFLKIKKVIITVMANQVLRNKLKEEKISFIETPVGDKYVAEEMLKNNCLLGGEQSGHIIFGKYSTTGDGILTALQILQMLNSLNKPISLLTHSITKFPQVLKNLKVKEKIPLERCKNLTEIINKYKNTSDGRVLVRYSGTEPYLRIMVEDKSKKILQKKINEIVDCAKKDLEIIE